MRTLQTLLLAAVLTGCGVTTAEVDTDTDTDSDTVAPTEELACTGAVPTTLSKESEWEWSVEVNDTWRGCETADDCVLMDPLCSECCELVAICGDLRQDYLDEKWNTHCDGYDGGVCDCAPVEAEARCDDGRCTVVILDEG